MASPREGVGPNIRALHPTQGQATPLYTAVLKQQADAVRALIAAGAEADVECGSSYLLWFGDPEEVPLCCLDQRRVLMRRAVGLRLAERAGLRWLRHQSADAAAAACPAGRLQPSDKARRRVRSRASQVEHTWSSPHQ